MEKVNLSTYLKQLSLQEKTKDPTLEAMQWLMSAFGNPQDQVKCVHVAGTNGKGSICEMLSNILIKAGYRVGKYMSPHLISVNERICIDNIPISDQESSILLEELDEKIQEYNSTHKNHVTYFEVVTALAFIYFARKKCDIMIVETGLGGLLDSTNIVSSSISVISTIAYDHMAILGNTLEEIAIQKAGIIKQKGNTIFVWQPEKEVVRIIEDTCKEKKNRLYIINPEDIQNRRITKDLAYFDYQEFKYIPVKLKGEKQITNACICIEVCKILKNENFKISEKAMKEGLSTVVHKARFEKLSDDPTIIFDGGHNENAIQNLNKTIQTYYKNDRKVYILSILKSKDYKIVIKELIQEDRSSIFFFTDGIDKERYVGKEELYKEAKKYRQNNIYMYDLEEAISIVKEQYRKDVIFVIGSFYIYPKICEILKIE